MKASAPEQIQEFNASVGENRAVPDPFAVDLFATRGNFAEVGEGSSPTDAQTDSSAEQPTPPAAPGWHARLPRITRGEARRSSEIAMLPAPLGADNIEALMGTITRYMHVSPEAVSLTLVDLREAELGVVAQSKDVGASVFASLIVEPYAARIAVELDTGFTAALVDRMLGGDGLPPRVLRALSISERACLEFLWLSVISELNRVIGEPVVKLSEVAVNPPSWFFAAAPGLDTTATASNAQPVAPHGLVLVARIGIDTTIGYARLYLDSNSLASLNANENPLLSAHSAGRGAGEKIQRMKRLAPTVPVSIVVGKTEIAGEDLTYLERGDVVVVAQPEARWLNGELRGKLRVRVGSGHASNTLTIVGKAVSATRHDVAVDREAGAKDVGTIKLAVEAILGGDTRAEAERIKMEENAANEETTGTAGADLGGLLLTLHVELAAQRIRLDELAQLRPGQVVDLGCNATDPVDLVTEERRIARGELVDIEGRLGVRITQVFT